MERVRLLKLKDCGKSNPVALGFYIYCFMVEEGANNIINIIDGKEGVL